MVRTVTILLLTLVLWGCGGSDASLARQGFINQTRHSDAELRTLWQAAQQQIARQIDLNPLQQSQFKAAAHLLPGDSRALTVMPQQLTVAPQPDVSAQALFDQTGMLRADPTGLIACPQPCNVRYAVAYSHYRPRAVNYAASWESEDGNFDPILQYEFENQILFTLGYDMTWR